MIKKNIGERLKECRKQVGLSQGDVAFSLHTTKQNVSSWECNRTEPNNEVLIELSKIYGTTVDYILNGDNEHLIKYAEKLTNRDDLIEKYYEEKEAERVLISYINAPEAIKEAVCKLLDVERR